MGVMRSVGVRLRLFTDDYARDAAKAKGATETVGDSAKKTKKDYDQLATGLGVAGGALVALAGIAVATTMKFDKQMSEVGAVAGATGEQLAQLRQAALDAGAATVYSASEAAQAEAELAKAGVSTAEILGGGLTGALSLAAAGSLELADAATIAAKTMNIFHLGGKDVSHIADVLAAAANKSATDVNELGQALAMGGAAAANSGISLEETVGTLAAFADNALAGSDGGTSFKTMLQMLAAPSTQATEQMKKLGIEAYDASGNFVGLAKFAGQLHDKLGGLTQEQRNHALAVIFGNDAMRAATALYNEGEQGILDYTAAVNDQGAAARVAAQKMDNLSGDVEQLKGSLETLFIESGSGASGGLRSLVRGTNDLVDAFGNLPNGVKTVSVELAGVAGAMLLVTAGAIKMQPKIAAAATELRALGAAGGVAATGLEGAAVALGPVTAVLTAAYFATDHFYNRLKDPTPLSNLEKIVAIITTTPIGMNIFSEMMSGPAVKKVKELADETETAAQKQQDLNRAMIAGVEAGDKLIDTWNTLHGAMKTADEQMLDVINAQEALAKSFEDNGLAVDGNSKAALENRIAMENMAQQAYEAADAMIANGASADEAQAQLDQFKQMLEATAQAAGLSRDEAEKLADQLFRMPAVKNIDVNVNYNYTSQGATYGGQAAGPNWAVNNARGGVYVRHAATGALSGAAVYNAGAQPLYAFAEQGTGGEAFVPRRGNYGRSMGILQAAAGWYGADVVPQSGWSGAGTPVQVRNEVKVSAGPGLGGAIVGGLQFDVTQVGGGSVQDRYGRRGRL